MFADSGTLEVLKRAFSNGGEGYTEQLKKFSGTVNDIAEGKLALAGNVTEPVKDFYEKNHTTFEEVNSFIENNRDLVLKMISDLETTIDTLNAENSKNN